jgi:UDP-N-acetyl-D-galactosamine dehydrogenase
LTTKAQQLGYHPQVILAGRRINDSMGSYVAQRVVKLMVNANMTVKGARIGVLGLTFKENVADLRNSRVPDIIRELVQFGAQPLVHDPHAAADKAHEEYGIELVEFDKLRNLDAVVLAVGHDAYKEMGLPKLLKSIGNPKVLADIKGLFFREPRPADTVYWSL